MERFDALIIESSVGTSGPSVLGSKLVQYLERNLERNPSLFLPHFPFFVVALKENLQKNCVFLVDKQPFSTRTSDAHNFGLVDVNVPPDETMAVC